MDEIENLRKWCLKTKAAWEEYQACAEKDRPEEDWDRTCAYFEWCAERVDFDAVLELFAKYDALRAQVSAGEKL